MPLGSARGFADVFDCFRGVGKRERMDARKRNRDVQIVNIV